MADLVIGAMGSLVPKLGELLKEEYNLQTGMKERIDSLTQELELAKAALNKVADVPWDQLDEHVQIWARQLREASYDMEDVLDTFLVRDKGPANSTQQESRLKRFCRKMASLCQKSKARREISVDIKDIFSHLQEVTERCRKYKVDDIVVRSATPSTYDPRLHAMYNKVKNLVGIHRPRRELINMLQPPGRDDASNTKLKIVSIVGVGGLGKTTLAKAVYDKLKEDFDCGAFVPVGRNPDLKKVFKDILSDLDEQRYLQFNAEVLDEKQLIDKLHSFLKNKRYFIVIDDIWERESWKTIKLAIDDENNYGGRIIITTRNSEVTKIEGEVSKIAGEVYKIQPLPYDSSRELLFTRIAGPEAKYVDNQPDEIYDKFIRKCQGIPLAIITMASLLAGKQKGDWSEIYETIGFGDFDNNEAKNTMRILSFSYYDLPEPLRACLQYLSAFPEDSVIHKDSLVWMWVAEGFVNKKHPNQGKRLFEIGEGYFIDLINRSMVEAVESRFHDSVIIGCRVHDMMLDFIRSKSREETFFTVLDNDQGTLLQNNARRLANCNGIIGHTHHFEIPKLRSFIALGCVIETWAPLSNFKLLRVLAIEECIAMDGTRVGVEHIRHLLHLRFLSLRGTWVGKIPQDIGDLRFLQTLDLWGSKILELPPSCNLLKQLARLCITFDEGALDVEVLSVGSLTSLEELAIDVWNCKTTKSWVLKEVGSLRELRALHAKILSDEESARDLVESLRHLHKLQSLTIHPKVKIPTRQAMELVLPCHLRHLVVYNIEFCKLPSIVNPSCLPNLCRLNLRLQHVDEQDLKILGGMPELCYLGLGLWSSSATISSISNSDACYFPKLRCCRLWGSMVLFVGNREDKSVSFHIWNEQDHIAMPFVSDDELQRPRPSVSDDELKSNDELDRPLQRSKLNQVCQHLLISNRSSTPGNAEDPIAMRSVSSDEKKGSDCSKGAASAPPNFMPCLQVLHFRVRGEAIEDHPDCCDNLGLEHLPALREISVDLTWCRNHDTKEKAKEALRSAAKVHPNRPTLRLITQTKQSKNSDAEEQQLLWGRDPSLYAFHI